MDIVRKEFNDKFRPSDPQISYYDFFITQGGDINIANMLERRLWFILWFRNKGRLIIRKDLSVENNRTIVEKARRFATACNELLEKLGAEIDEYSILFDAVVKVEQERREYEIKTYGFSPIKALDQN